MTDPDHPDPQIVWSVTGNYDLQVSINSSRIAVITVPDPDWNGRDTLTFRATDPGGLWDSDNAVFTVNAVNDPPQITSQPITGATATVAYQYPVTAIDPDPGDVLTFGLTSAPSFLQINTTTGLISGTPAVSDSGTHPVTVRVTDLQGASDTQSYQLQVLYLNQPPVVSNIPNQTIDEGQNFVSISLDNYVTDPDHPDPQIVWSVTGNYDLLVSINSSRIAVITVPDPDWNGRDTLTFRATDPGGLWDSDNAVFTVNAVNDPPQITSQPVTGATATVAYQYPVTAIDPDPGDVLTFGLTSAPSFLQINTTTGLISGTPAVSDSGTHPVTVRVSDLQGASDTQSYQLQVLYVNQPPVVSNIPNQTIDEGQNFVSISLDNYVTDPDHPDPQIVWSVTGNYDLLVSINSSRIAVITVPDPDWNGRDTLTFRATDPGGLWDSDNAVFTVNGVNDPPQITSQPITGATRGVLYQYLLTVVDPDPEDRLTFSLPVAPSFLSIQTQSGLISGTPALADAGSHPVSVRVQDTTGATDTQNYTLTVLSNNLPPVVSGIPDQTIAEGETFVSIPLDNYVTDPESPDEDIIWLFRGNTDLAVSINNDRIAFITIPDPEWSGAESIIFTARDPGGLFDEQTASFQVTAVNDPPQLLLSELVIENAQNNFFDLTGYVIDADHSSLTMEWEFYGYQHFQMVWEDSVNRIIRILNPDNSLYESGYFVVTDPGGLSDTAAVQIFWRAGGFNTPPSLANLPGFLSCGEDNSIQLTLTPLVTDSSNTFNELTWEFFPAPDINYTYNAQSHSLVVYPNPDYYGQSNIRVKVTDPEGLFDEKNIVFQVNPRVDLTQLNITHMTSTEVQVAVQGDIPSQVEMSFWISPTLKSTYKSLNFDMSHVFSLRNLTPDTTYGYSLTLIDTSGFVQTYQDSTFETRLQQLPLADAEEVFVYPNPYRSSSGHSVVVFDNLPVEMTGLLVFTPAGEKVFEKKIAGIPQRRMPWTVINIRGDKLASGLYIYVVQGENGQKISSGKLAVIR